MSESRERAVVEPVRAALAREFGFCLEDDFVAAVAAEAGVEPAAVRAAIATCLNEAATAHALVAPYLDKDRRMLEVGPGIPFLALYLCRRGYRIEAVEPYAGAFRPFALVTRRLLAAPGSPALRLHDLDITRAGIAGGRYDLIFSLNVLEHLEDPEAAFRHMGDMLAEAGLMVHSCPNYVVPYEPHFGIFYLPFLPRSALWLHRTRIAGHQALWDSLNFITQPRVRAIAARQGLRVRFAAGVMFAQILRLESDPLFGQRHRMLRTLLRLLLRLGMAGLLRRIPPALATPMSFVVTRHG